MPNITALVDQGKIVIDGQGITAAERTQLVNSLQNIANTTNGATFINNIPQILLITN